jgi:hypothetical protein
VSEWVNDSEMFIMLRAQLNTHSYTK